MGAEVRPEKMVGGDERGSAMVGDSPNELADDGNGEEERGGRGRCRRSTEKTKGGGFMANSSSGDIFPARAWSPWKW